MASTRLGASEPLGNLLPERIRHRLASIGLNTLADLSKTSEDRLLEVEGIGRLTAYRLRRVLQTVGLDFKESDDPLARARRINRQARIMPMAERVRGLGDATHVAQLGLDWRAVVRCSAHGVTTIGQLRQLSRSGLGRILSKRTAAEVIAWLGVSDEALDASGSPERASPSSPPSSRARFPQRDST